VKPRSLTNCSVTGISTLQDHIETVSLLRKTYKSILSVYAAVHKGPVCATPSGNAVRITQKAITTKYLEALRKAESCEGNAAATWEVYKRKFAELLSPVSAEENCLIVEYKKVALDGFTYQEQIQAMASKGWLVSIFLYLKN
jgi:hypothetical protein